MKDIKIGITGMCGYYDLNRILYGVTPVHDPAEVEKFDLIILSGGEDINPKLYGEESTFSYGVNDKRDELEKAVLLEAIALNKQVIGICRGHQLINAVLGGKLYQDIFAETGSFHSHVEHILLPNRKLFWGNGRLAELFPVSLNSLHHQAVSIPGKDMEVLLRAKDGLIESTANKSGSIVSFQFHPEWNHVGDLYFQEVLETGKILW